MPNFVAGTPKNGAPLYGRIRLAAGWLLTVLAIPVVPLCWLASAALHERICGVGQSGWACNEPVGAFFLHQALVSWSPMAALLLFAVGDELRRRR